MTDMIINKLPSKTWNWLKVNETKLSWDMEHTTVLPEENVAVKEEPVHFSVQGEGEYSSKKFNIHAAKDEQITVYMDYLPCWLRFVRKGRSVPLTCSCFWRFGG